MDIFEKDTFIQLANHNETPCVSIYLPTSRVDRKSYEEGRIKFKNALSEAEKQLKASGMGTNDVNVLLTKGQELYDDTRFWQSLSDNLAVFIAPTHYSYYSLPIQTAEKVVVQDSFYLVPLASLTQETQHYYILALAKGGVYLYEATRNTITDIIIDDLVPKNQEDALRFDDQEKTLQHHSGNGEGNAMFHGQGGAKDVATENLQRYLRVVDKGINSLLARENAPVLLAGDKNVVGEFRNISRIKLIMDDAITGNMEYLPMAEVHEMSKDIMMPYFNKQLKNAHERYRQVVGTGLSSTAIDDVVLAGRMEKIDTLFINAEAEAYGNIHFDKLKVDVHTDGTGTELINDAAVQTILHGGNVYMMNGDMPENKQVAALYRF